MERSTLGANTNEPPESRRAPAYLSAVASESSNTIRARTDKEALRPIYLNGVEVGFAYAQNDVDKRLSVRGVTIALFHFLAAGHQVLALLPHCFKLYREKSTDHEELLALHRMNLVEFTPGYGSDKYVEVNRLAAGAAFESGGCIVARSQMHAVVSERPCLEEIVEKRLLMPSFMGEDIIFPIDGPLGRIGASLAETLVCRPTDADYAACCRSQLLLADQMCWLQRLSNLLPEKLAWSSLASHFNTWQPSRKAAIAPEVVDTGLCITLAGPIRPPESNPAHGRGFSAQRRRTNNFARDHYNCPERLRDTRDPNAEEEDDDDFLPSYAVGDRDLPPEPSPRRSSSSRDPLEDGQELHIGRPGSLYRIVSADEMATREREHSTAVVTAAAKPAEIRDSAFRRGAGDFAERQIPGPRRFGFGTSPPRRHNSGPAMIYERPSPPRSGHHDTPRHSTILPPSSGGRMTRPSTTTMTSSCDVRVGAGIADVIRSQSDVDFEQQQQLLQLQQQQRLLQQVQETPQQPQHPAFSQLALVLGFELAKKVTQRHPRETDMNRLANLALDITTAAPAAADNHAVTPSRSASTTSATSTPSESRRRTTFHNRSPAYGGERRFGGGRGGNDRAGGGRASPLGGGRARAHSTPSAAAPAARAAADDSFANAVSAASTAEASLPSPLAPSSPPPAFEDVINSSDDDGIVEGDDDGIVEDDAGHDDPQTDATAAEDEDDLIDWDGEAAAEAPHSSASVIVESSHLLD